MNHISTLLGTQITPVKAKRTEYGDLLEYFFSIGMKDRNNRQLSKGAIGFLLSPLIRGTKEDRDYGLLYTLKDKCGRSNNPAATFWCHVRPKRK